MCRKSNGVGPPQGIGLIRNPARLLLKIMQFIDAIWSAWKASLLLSFEGSHNGKLDAIGFISLLPIQTCELHSMIQLIIFLRDVTNANSTRVSQEIWSLQPTEGRAWLSVGDKARHLASWSRHGWILADDEAGSGGVINVSVGSSGGRGADHRRRSSQRHLSLKSSTTCVFPRQSSQRPLTLEV